MLNDYKFFKTRDSVELRTRPLERAKKTWIICVHGVGEHLERHNYLVEVFSHDFNIFQFDLRGHGRSGGKRGYVENFQEYSKDLDEMLRCLQKTYKMDRFILFGHSMGALVVANYMNKFVKDDLYPQAIFLSSPPVWPAGPLGKLTSVLPSRVFDFCSGIGPSIEIPGLVDLKYLSHDTKIKDEYIQDDLNLKKLHSKLIFNMLLASRESFGVPLRCKVPLFATVGEEDGIVSVSALKNYFGQIELAGQLKVFEGGYHELHNEISRIKDPYINYLKEVINLFK